MGAGSMSDTKPLGFKSYGHIPHLPGSRVGVGDHTIGLQQSKLATEKCRKGEWVICQEKLDGSNVAVANIDGAIVPLIRAGYHARSSHREMHHRFADWVDYMSLRFGSLLMPGERACGEWLIQAHGTRYALPHEPFVLFDIIRGHERALTQEVQSRSLPLGFTNPHIIAAGPTSIEAVVAYLDANGSHHGALDPVEGAVWRVESMAGVNFLCKYVRPTKNDRKYLRDVDGIEVEPTMNTWVGEPT